MNKGKKKLTAIDYILYTYFIIVAFLVFIGSTPWLPATRRSARDKSCYSNIRVLLGAAEMYNMDTSVMVTKMDERFASSLKAKNYLKETPRCPETNSFDYFSNGDISKSGYIWCKYHGDLEGKRRGQHQGKESLGDKIVFNSLGKMLLAFFLLVIVSFGIFKVGNFKK